MEKRISILRRKQVEKRTGLSRSTIYLRIQEGTFPRPVNLGTRAVGWLENEIQAWLESRIENRGSRPDIKNRNREKMVSDGRR